MPQNPGALKRQKELARLEWQAEKAAKRKQKASEKREQAEKGKPHERPRSERPA